MAGEAGNIYFQTSNGELVWEKDLNQNGSVSWAAPAYPKPVGAGWNYSKLFSGRGGVIYSVDSSGQLIWHRDGNQNGSTNLSGSSGKIIGWGWNAFTTITSPGNGYIYAVDTAGYLRFYHHLDATNGTVSWDGALDGSVIGNGWNGFTTITADTDKAGKPILYAVDTSGNLRWYRVTTNGQYSWDPNNGKIVGIGWNGLIRIFAAGNGVIYGVDTNGALRWYRDTLRDGTTTAYSGWAAGSGAILQTGWLNFKSGFQYPNASLAWGRLAGGQAGQSLKGAYFFAGDMMPGSDSAFFGFHSPTPNVDYNWSQPGNASKILEQVSASGVNVIVAPYFDTRNCSNRFSDVQDDSYYRLYNTSTSRTLSILPVLEASKTCSTGPYPSPEDCKIELGCEVTDYAFSSDVTTRDRATGRYGSATAQRISKLISQFSNAGKLSRWTQIFSRSGVPRYAVNLFHAGGVSVAIGAEIYKERLADIADQVRTTSHVEVGFTLDTWCDHPEYCFGGPRVTDPLTARSSAAALANSEFILGIQNFGSEVLDFLFMADVANQTRLNSSTVNANIQPDAIRKLINFKRELADSYASSIPTYVDISPGYLTPPFWLKHPNANDPSFSCSDLSSCARGTMLGDEGDNWQWSAAANDYRRVGPALGRNNSLWRNSQAALKWLPSHAPAGFVADAWNKYDEGMPFADTATVSEAGQVPDEKRRWLGDFLGSEPGDCSFWHYNAGYAAFRVSGGICARYTDPQVGLWGALGAPISNESGIELGGGDNTTASNPNCASDCSSVRKQRFEHGTMYWDNNGPHFINGIIHDKFIQSGAEAGFGLPYEDELPLHAGGNPAGQETGANAHFYNGSMIYWKKGSQLAYKLYGQIGAKWASMGWELSASGFPVSDESLHSFWDAVRNVYHSGSVQYFERGAIFWAGDLPWHSSNGVSTTAWYCPAGVLDSSCY